MYDRSTTKNKWTIMKYIKDFDKMLLYADAVRHGMSDISDDALDSIQEDMRIKNIYNPRTTKQESKVVTIRNKVNQIVFYMFGYKLKKGTEYKIVFSPLGNLLLDNRKNDRWVSRIFFSMLYSMEFKHPFNLMKADFKIYPYRLIFKLLLDKRLNGKLYHDEVFYYVMFLKDINKEKYENLITDILNFRKMSVEQKIALFKKDEHVVANALHEWNYATGILEQANIAKIYNDDNDKNRAILVHGNGSGRRKYKLNYIKLREDIVEFAKIMSDKYSYDSCVKRDVEDMLQSEYITQMYNFYPEELLDELGIRDEEQEQIHGILKITDLINEYALNENNRTYKKFEHILCDAFNLFKNIKCEVIATAGTTDIECIYKSDDSVKKFDIEAKSTSMKLMQINAGRLRSHRRLIGSKYTIVVTPQYAPAVKSDIEDTDNVILLSSTLSNFIYQYSRKFGRDLDYKLIDDIIVNNMGRDITDILNDYIYTHLGTSY